MNALHLSFNTHDTSGRGCVFVFKGKKNEIYLRAKVSNASTVNLGLARLFLTRIERVDAKGNKIVITDDTLPLNWALSGGADVHFYSGIEQYADLLTFIQGAKAFKPMTLRSPAYWAQDLAKPGIYRLHLLLTGPAIKSTTAIFEIKWPIKKLSPSTFSFSVAK